MTTIESLRFRKASVADIKAIHGLINASAAADEMLPRSLSDLFDKLRDFHVCEIGGRVQACCALHIVWDEMAEVRSLAVAPDARGQNIGQELIRQCIAEGVGLGVSTIFALTYIPKYFEKLGFAEVSKDILPHKIWSDCVKCPKFPDCGETAMMLSNQNETQSA